MDSEIEKILLEKIKYFYPERLSIKENSRGYLSSGEYKRFAKKTGDFHANAHHWQKKVELLNATVKTNFYLVMPNHLDRCLSFQMKVGNKKDKNLRLQLGISALAPFFSIFLVKRIYKEVPEEESLWHGECFVFDGRVSVGHRLVEGPYGLCHACRMPISDSDRAAPEFEEGVSCPRCIQETTEDAKARFRERQKQIRLAEARGETHVGS